MHNCDRELLPTLASLYENHVGKVSDKWRSYLTLYDRELSDLRCDVRSLLEIGVQNGGSLEIWAKYFPAIQCIVGCDINPACRKLTYGDQRISVIVGDATNAQTKAFVLAAAAEFDLVFEDGSHFPADVIAAFLHYWPHIRAGGAFVAEDLCCDYFPSHQGGIARKDTATRFFGQLTQVINHEHWANVTPVHSLFREFNISVPINADALCGTIASISFHNSVVIVRKARNITDTLLGARVVVGEVAVVDDRVLSIKQSGDSSLLGLHEKTTQPAKVGSFAGLFR